MVDSVQQIFCEKIVIPSDFICMFKMSFFFLAHPVYRPHQNKIETPYALCPHPLPVPQVTHVYAEASIDFKLVSMKNKIFPSKNYFAKNRRTMSYINKF